MEHLIELLTFAIPVYMSFFIVWHHDMIYKNTDARGSTFNIDWKFINHTSHTACVLWLQSMKFN